MDFFFTLNIVRINVGPNFLARKSQMRRPRIIQRKNESCNGSKDSLDLSADEVNWLRVHFFFRK